MRSFGLMNFIIIPLRVFYDFDKMIYSCLSLHSYLNDSRLAARRWLLLPAKSSNGTIEAHRDLLLISRPSKKI